MIFLHGVCFATPNIKITGKFVCTTERGDRLYALAQRFYPETF